MKPQTSMKFKDVFDKRVKSYARNHGMKGLKNAEQAARMFTDVMNKHSHTVELYAMTPIPEDHFEKGFAWRAIFPNSKAGVALYVVHHTLGRAHHDLYTNACTANGGTAPDEWVFDATRLSCTEDDVLAFTASLADNPKYNPFRRVLADQDEADMVFYYGVMAGALGSMKKQANVDECFGEWMFLAMFHLAFAEATERVARYTGAKMDQTILDATCNLRVHLSKDQFPAMREDAFGTVEGDAP